MSPFRIVDNIYYVGSSGMSSYLIATQDGLILLDCGTAETATQVLGNIRQLGFNPRQVKILIGLHGHYDHVGGAARIKQATGAKLFLGAADRRLVESGGTDDFQWGNSFAWEPVKVNRSLKDGDKLRLGGVELRIHATPGHTQGTITCTMDLGPKGQSCHVLFAGSVTCPEYQLVGNLRYPGINKDFEQTFTALSALPCDVFLTEHGWDCDLTNKARRLEQTPGANPFIDPTGYRQYLEQAEARYHDLLSKQSNGAKKAATSN